MRDGKHKACWNWRARMFRRRWALPLSTRVIDEESGRSEGQLGAGATIDADTAMHAGVTFDERGLLEPLQPMARASR